MWCDDCDRLSFCKKATIRITNDGNEILIEICGSCGSRSETKYFKGSTTRITDTPPKITKTKLLKRNLRIKVKKKNEKKFSRLIKKTSLGNKLR